MNRISVMTRMLCVSAFVSVALSTALPSVAHATDTPSLTAVASLPAGIVATVNGAAIMSVQLADAVRMSGQPDTPALRQALKERLVTNELIRQAAGSAQYDRRPEAVQAANAAGIQVASQLYLHDHVHPTRVSDSQVKVRYHAMVASLGPIEYKPRTIVVANRAAADRALAKLKKGVDFDALAREISLAPNRTAGGAVAWAAFKTPLAEGNTLGFPMKVAREISRLPAGGVSKKPINLGDRWVIVKLDARRATQIPPFDQAKEQIRQQLEAISLEQATTQFVGELRKDATIQQ